MTYQTETKLTINTKYQEVKDQIYKVLKKNKVDYVENGRVLKFASSSDITYQILALLEEIKYRGSVDVEFTMSDDETTTVAQLYYQDAELVDESYEYHT